MSQYQRILVICDPRMVRTPAVERAVRLARATGASLRLCLFDHHPGIRAVGAVSSEVMELAKAGFLGARDAWLQQLAASLSADGLQVETEAVWAAQTHETIIAKVFESLPDLVIKDVHAEPALRRLLYTPLDWQLMRLCPAPLLLVNPHAHPLPKRVIAAVDTAVIGDTAETLNEVVVKAALQLSLQSNASLHLVHAFEGLAATALPDPAGDGVLVAEAYSALRDMSVERFDDFARRQGVSAEYQHFLEGPSAEAIAEFADTVEADVVAIGTVYREGLERLLMGSSAERILQRLHCDILVVKPPSFIDQLAQHIGIPKGVHQRLRD